MEKSTQKNQEVISVEAEEIIVSQLPVRTVEDTIRADVAVFDKYEQRAEELRTKYAHVKINGREDKEGYVAAKLAVRELRTTRTGNEKDRKEAKSFYIECGRAVDSKAGWIDDVLLSVENPIKKDIKDFDDEAEREKQEKIQAAIQRSKVRVAELTKLGVAFDGADYVSDDISYSQDVIRDSTEDHFLNKILPQYKSIFDAKEAIRVANEEALKEQDRLRKKAADDLKEEQRKLKESQDKLLEDQRKIDKEKQDTLIARGKKRIQQCIDLGLNYDIINGDFTLGKIWIVKKTLEEYPDYSWDSLISDGMPDIENAKKEIQDEKDKEQKRLSDVAVAKAGKDREEKEEKDKIKKQQELEEANDKTKYSAIVDYLKRTPLYDMRSGQYRQKMIAIRTFIDDLK